MSLQISFPFRQKSYEAKIWFAFNDEPCFLFITLFEEELIKEFGGEVSIMTDGDRLLPKHDDYTELIKLRTAIFNAVKITDEFKLMKAKYISLNKRRKKEREFS